MAAMPESCAMLAVDIVRSSAADDDLLAVFRPTLYELLSTAFDQAGLDFAARQNVSPAGDGDLMCLPERDLPGVIDLAHHLNNPLFERNRRHKPAIQLRLAAHSGPMVLNKEPDFQRGYIELSRMIAAKELGNVVRHCLTAEPFTLALIVSDQAYRSAIRGGHTKLRPHQFARVQVRNKEYEEPCWIYVPGHAPTDLVKLASKDDAAAQPTDAKASGHSHASINQDHVQGNAIAGDLNGNAVANFGTWSGTSPHGPAR